MKIEEMAERTAQTAYRLAVLDGAHAVEPIRVALEQAREAGRQQQRERAKQIVSEVNRQARRDAVLVGPAVTGWAIREILRRLEAE